MCHDVVKKGLSIIHYVNLVGSSTAAISRWDNDGDSVYESVCMRIIKGVILIKPDSLDVFHAGRGEILAKFLDCVLAGAKDTALAVVTCGNKHGHGFVTLLGVLSCQFFGQWQSRGKHP